MANIHRYLQSPDSTERDEEEKNRLLSIPFPPVFLYLNSCCPFVLEHLPDQNGSSEYRVYTHSYKGTHAVSTLMAIGMAV